MKHFRNLYYIFIPIIAVCFLPDLFAHPVTAGKYSIEQYLSIKSASSPSFSPDGREIAYLTNVTGTSQIWIVDISSGRTRQVTNFEDNVSFVRWLPDGRLLFGKARGGDENTQFFLISSKGGNARQLTGDSSVRNNFGAVSRDGKFVFFASNKRNRNYFDIYRMDVDSGEEKILLKDDGNNSVAAVNDDGTKIIISRSGTEKSLDNDLYLLELHTQKLIHLTPHEDASEFSDPHFVADGVVMASNSGREFSALLNLKKKNAAIDEWSNENLSTGILDAPKWDVTDIAMNHNGGKIVYSVNREGFSELYFLRAITAGKPLITVFSKKALKIPLPERGIVAGPTLSRDESKLAFAFSSPVRNSDIWIYDFRSGKLSQITKSDRSGIDAKSFVSPELITYKSFDGLSVSAWFYRPSGADRIIAKGNSSQSREGATFIRAARVPVIVSVHGGPESQERPGFNPLYQYYLSRGFAIFAPNVRGSTGYGKYYTHLDDVRNREDSVRDLAAGVDWLRRNGNVEPRSIAVMGGSYGGYMTMAAITLYPDLWAAAVNTVGIVNWETFLKNTSGYRRRQREVEYGRLDRDLDFLRSISPIRRVDLIKCPLFVIHGKNDPRVPYTEAEQVVTALRNRGAVVEYKLYDDEGHGISKLKNRLDLYPRVAAFLEKYLKPR